MIASEVRCLPGSSDEIASLVELLHKTDQRLDELLAGEVDSVTARNGCTMLLRRAQGDLRDSENARQAAILGALPASIALLDIRGFIVSVNPAWCRFADVNGLRSGHAVGVNYLDICDRAVGEDSFEAQRASGGIRAVLRGSVGSFSIEYPCHSPTERRWFLLTVTPLAGAPPNGAVVMHFNVTDRVLVDEQQRATRQLLDNIVENIPTAVQLLSVDDDFRIRLWNKASEKMFGLPRDAAIGRNAHDLWPEADAAPMLASHLELVAGGDMQEFPDRRVPTKNGDLRVHMRKVALRDAHGKASHLLIIADDIAAQLEEAASLRRAEQTLRTSEMRFRQLAENIRDVFFLRSADDAELRYVSPAYVEVFGRTCESLYADPTSWTQAVHPDDLLSFRRQQAADRPGNGFEREYRILRPDGAVRWLAVRGFPVQDEDSGIALVAGVASDITERRYHQDALRELNAALEGRVEARTLELKLARDEAQQANQAKSAFLATMSHEIRTPMNGVIGMIEVLQQTSLRGQQMEMVDLIRDSAFSLLQIIEDILDLSKIEAGKMSVENEPMQLAETVEKVCGMLDHLALKRGVRMTAFVDPAIPHLLVGDEGRLRQVLVNLTGNAIKFSGGGAKPGRVSVRVVLVERLREQVSVDLIVSDDGIGIEETTLARLFTPFSQADSSTTRRFGGSGLGLAISSMLVHLMGGSISVQSTPGKGSVFAVRLTFATSDDGAHAVDADAAVAGLRCRIVGHELPLADDLDAYLRHAGVSVERSPDLAAAAAVAPSSGSLLWLVLPDQGMPGVDALRALTAGRDAQLRFVVLGWGVRRRPEADAEDLVGLDADTLSRAALFQALAMASGRIVEPDPAVKGDASCVHPAPVRQQARLQGRLILVAEDNVTNRVVILRQLGLIGFAAEVAVDGREALERWRSGDFALLLTDLHMPEMDGYALARAIRAEETPGRRTPIVALTANAMRDEEVRCRAAGMDGYLSKPVRLAQLKVAIEAWLGPTSRRAEATRLPAPLPIPAPPVDLAVLTALIGDDRAVIDEVLQAFRESALLPSAELNRGIGAEAAQPVAAAAHKMKSGARSIGALRLGDLCAQLEEIAESGKTGELKALLPLFQAELDAVLRFLDAR